MKYRRAPSEMRWAKLLTDVVNVMEATRQWNGITDVIAYDRYNFVPYIYADLY